jgi:hypothetical protein
MGENVTFLPFFKKGQECTIDHDFNHCIACYDNVEKSTYCMETHLKIFTAQLRKGIKNG